MSLDKGVLTLSELHDRARSSSDEALHEHEADGRRRAEKPPERIAVLGRDEALRLIHQHPGYARVQADSFVDPPEGDLVILAAKAAASAFPGFRAWSHRPRTGSVVIEYDPEAVEIDDLLVHVAKRAGFRGLELANRKAMNREELVSTFLDSVQGLNHVASQLTGGRADLREIVPASLAVTSVVSFVLHKDRGRLPHWATAAYHGYRVFMQWHRREIRTRERIARQEDESNIRPDQAFSQSEQKGKAQ